MKKLILLVFMIFGFGVSVNANGPKNVISNLGFTNTLAEKLRTYIKTGDVNELTSIMNPTNLCLLFWDENGLMYSPDCMGTREESEEYILKYLNIRTENPTIIKWTEGEYGFVRQEWGGFMIKLTITYDNSERIDHILVTTDVSGKIKSLSVHKDVVKNNYYDYNIDRVITE